eukprot:m.50946 g.50946  ORF g.50946 m.50946 type:complete len:63 (-) comp7273_c0_seq2:2692-2880(-)
MASSNVPFEKVDGAQSVLKKPFQVQPAHVMLDQDLFQLGLRGLRTTQDIPVDFEKQVQVGLG